MYGCSTLALGFAVVVSETTMLLRKTSAAIALRVPVDFALMVSLRRLTDERDIRRSGLSLDRLDGRGVGVRVGVGNDPGIVCDGLDTEVCAGG